MENNFDEQRSDGKEQTQANAPLCATIFTPHPKSDPDFMCSELTALKYLFPGILRHPSTTTAFQPVLFRRNMKGASGKMCGWVVVGNNFQMRSEV